MAYTTINKPTLYFNPVLYTGDDTTNRSITGVGFKPDWTWIKSRSNAYYHELYDAVRGFSSTTNGRVLYSNTTGAEGTPNTFNSFNTDGFTVSKQTGEVGTNGTGATYVAWNWLGANSTTTNTSGTITSTVSANTTSGFSIVSFTTTSGGNATIGHGLGSVPKMIIMKARDQTYNWDIYHVGIGNANRLVFTTASSASTTCWGSTTPTSSVFTMDQSFYGSGVPTIAYCFAEVRGYSKFDSYTGNGSTNGTFVFTGFKPAFVMTKASSTTGNWKTSWNSFSNGNDYNLAPNLNSAEGNANQIDLLSNGFKCRASDTDRNGSGTTYIYMAIAENPFVSATKIPTTAR